MPLVGAIIAGCLFAFAATRYPGGTAASPDSIGYSWAHNTFSALFQPYTLNGVINPARYLAATAAVIYCASLGIVFAIIAPVFIVVAVAATLHSLYSQRRMRLMAMGLFCVSLPICNAVVYYGDF